MILFYHRVANLSSDPQLLSVSPHHFAEHLEHVCKYYHPMSLLELVRALAAKRVPNRAVVITFDDGYADNLWNAKPLLDRYDVPATIFVATGYAVQNREFWWDELEKILLLPERLPSSLALNVNGEYYAWDLHETEERSTLRWDVTMEFCPSPRYKVYKELQRLLRPLDNTGQHQVLNALALWAGVSRDEHPANRTLNHDELKALDEGKIEIGSHSITHPLLSKQPLEVQKREIAVSKRYLEDILGHSVNSFSYPYGGEDAADENTEKIVREAGYEMACCTVRAPVTRYSNPYWLPRYLVRNWDGEEFASRLKSGFHG